VNLTTQNGLVLNVDRKKMTEFGPHIAGGSFVKVNGHNYLVTETVEEILKLKDDG
jgi:hypothetical protein